jgi:hypothetical protein
MLDFFKGQGHGVIIQVYDKSINTNQAGYGSKICEMQAWIFQPAG